MTYNKTRGPWKGLGIFVISLITQSSQAAMPDGLALKTLHQRIETSKKQYLDQKERYEVTQEQAQKDLETLQKESEIKSANLLKSIQDETAQKEEIQKNVEALKGDLQKLEASKLDLLKTKRQALQKKHQETHRLRQILLKVKRINGEHLTKLYAKG